MKHTLVIAAAALVFATVGTVGSGVAHANPYLVAAADTAAQLNAQELGRIQSGAPPMAPPPAAAAEVSGGTCPPGREWMPDGYGKHGKWRPAGCYRR